MHSFARQWKHENNSALYFMYLISLFQTNEMGIFHYQMAGSGYLGYFSRQDLSWDATKIKRKGKFSQVSIKCSQAMRVLWSTSFSLRHQRQTEMWPSSMLPLVLTVYKFANNKNWRRLILWCGEHTLPRQSTHSYSQTDRTFQSINLSQKSFSFLVIWKF